MKKIFIVFIALFSVQLYAVSPELKLQAENAIIRGCRFLTKTQMKDGNWSDPRFPGMSALALWALAGSKQAEFSSAAEKAAAYIASCVQPDGGIYQPIPGRQGSGLGNYNTSLAVTALHASGYKEKYIRVIQNARTYIVSTQIEADGIHQGGFGYDKNSTRLYTDLNNTFYAVDAIARTQDVEESRPANEKRVDIDWDAAKKYILSMQQDDGGFVYNKQDPKAGMKKSDGKQKKNERPQLKAYGSMSYAGLLAMLHCKLQKSDVRVLATCSYLSKYWTLDENPGMGNQGLFFYYNILARALSHANVPVIEHENKKLEWKTLLIKKILSLQKEDGSWVNENNRFWEADPVLSSSYALLALEMACDLTK